MRVQDIMNTTPACCHSHDTLNEVAHQMWDHDCGALPVIGDDGRLVGMITDRDVCMAIYTKGKALNDLHVSDAMAAEVITCNKTQDINQVTKAMAQGRVRRAPVVDNDRKVIGMITIGDIARAASQSQARLQGLSCETVVSTLAAICAPRWQEAAHAGSAAGSA